MTPNSHTHWKYARVAYIVLAVCSVAYIILSLFSPSPTAARLYHLNETQRILLQLTIVIPMIVIWLIGLRGAVAFRQYAVFVKDSPESRALSLISAGLLWLIIYLVVVTISGTVMPYFVDSPILPLLVSLRNHLPVLASLTAFALILWGTMRLRRSAPYPVWTKGAFVLLATISVLTGFFAYLFLQTPPGINASGIPSHTLPREILVFTMVLPYCWAWFMGLLAALNVAKYAREVKGIIYRQALHNLTWGIVAAVTMVALMQCFTMTNRFLTQLNLGPLLLIVYVLLAICAVGFWFIRRGAKKLLRIEVVQ